MDEAGALAAAAAVDAKPRAERSPWEGVPIGLKDVLCVKGMETTCGSRILKGYVPPYDATVIAKLREAGLIFLGKLNMDEFAMGSSTENSAFKTTRNPWDLDRVPGGSSGGSAACVAAAEAPWALGTDTGGSIRQPASLCGVVGMKPTYGAVSRYGLIAFASSLDQIGPLTRDVKDAAALLDLVAGRDPRDSTSIGLPEPAGVPDAERPEGPALRGDQGVRGRRLRARACGRCSTRRSTPSSASGRRLRRGEPAQRGARRRRLLHHRPVGGQLQPGPLRRGALRPPDRAQPRTSTRCTRAPAARASAPRSSAAS